VGWMKAEDQTILTLHNKVVTHNSRISVTHDNYRTWQLHIRQVKESDRGCYMCQINTNVMKKQVGCVDVHGEFQGHVQTSDPCVHHEFDFIAQTVLRRKVKSLFLTHLCGLYFVLVQTT
jgi:hypothetical protein